MEADVVITGCLPPKAWSVAESNIARDFWRFDQSVSARVEAEKVPGPTGAKCAPICLVSHRSLIVRAHANREGLGHPIARQSKVAGEELANVGLVPPVIDPIVLGL